LKQFRLIWQSLHQVKGAVLLLMIVLTLALFVLTYLIGLVRYHSYSLTFLERAKIENAVYFKLAFDENQMEKDFYGTFASFAQTYQQISDWPGVRDVLSISSYGSVRIEENIYQVLVYDEALLRHFSVPLDGSWFSDKSAVMGNPVPVVLGGNAFSNIAIGDLLTGKTGEMQEPITLKVYGKVKFPGYTLSLGDSSTVILTDNLLNDTPVILVRDDPAIRAMLDSSDRLLISENAWVVFEDDLTEHQKKELLERLSYYGSYNAYDDIIIASRTNHIKQIKRILPIPLFLFFSAFSCLFSIASLYVLRNAQNQIVYFFCGCSKLRLLLILGQGLSLIFLPPALLNLLFIVFYPFIRRISWFNLHQVVLDGSVALLILLFLTVLLVLLLLQPLIINRGRSPLQLSRRMSS